MRVVPNEVNHHLHGASRQALNPCLATIEGLPEQAAQRRPALPQRSNRLGRRHSGTIKGSRRRLSTAHVGERSPHALRVRHNRRNGAFLRTQRPGTPDLLWQNADQVLGHTAAMVERLQKLSIRIRRLARPGCPSAKFTYHLLVGDRACDEIHEIQTTAESSEGHAPSWPRS